jgi:hypothetical protein
MSELQEALAVQPGDLELEKDYCIEPQDIIDCCQSLVIHDEPTGFVHFAHYTVQQFLASDMHHCFGRMLISLGFVLRT